MPKTRAWLLGCCLGLALTACATTSQEPAAPRPDAAHPRVVKLSFVNGLVAASYYYVADGVNVWLESHEPRDSHNATTPQVITRTTRTPSARRWDRFWTTLERMHVERWKPSYFPMDAQDGMVLSDGTDWTLTVATAWQTLRSGGDEAFPLTGHPDRTVALVSQADTDQNPRFLRPQDNMVDQLEEAFGELLQSPP